MPAITPLDKPFKLEDTVEEDGDALELEVAESPESLILVAASISWS